MPDSKQPYGGGGGFLNTLLPILAGVAGAATPGLGRGVSLALGVAQAQQEARRNRMFQEMKQRDMRSEEKMKAAALMAFEKDQMPALPQGRGPWGGTVSHEPDRAFPNLDEDDKNYHRTLLDVNPKGYLDLISGETNRMFQQKAEAEERARAEQAASQFMVGQQPPMGTSVSKKFGDTVVQKEGPREFAPKAADDPYDFRSTGQALLRVNKKDGTAAVVHRDPERPTQERQQRQIGQADLALIASGQVLKGFEDITPENAQAALDKMTGEKIEARKGRQGGGKPAGKPAGGSSGVTRYRYDAGSRTPVLK
jgi:hypothetical protein